MADVYLKQSLKSCLVSKALPVKPINITVRDDRVARGEPQEEEEEEEEEEEKQERKSDVKKRKDKKKKRIEEDERNRHFPLKSKKKQNIK